MKRTGIARSFEENILNVLIVNKKQLKDKMKNIADNIHIVIKNTELNKEEEREIFEIYTHVISGIVDIIKDNELLEKELINIKNYKETELKNE